MVKERPLGLPVKTSLHLAIVMCTCGPGTGEAKVGVGNHPWLQSEFKAIVGYRRPCLKTRKLNQAADKWFLRRNRERNGEVEKC